MTGPAKTQVACPLTSLGLKSPAAVQVPWIEHLDSHPRIVELQTPSWHVGVRVDDDAGTARLPRLTLLLAAGADLWAVQKMLRHTDAQVTTERYAHLVPGYLQTQIGRLKLVGFASHLLPRAETDGGPTRAPDRNDQDSRELRLERETGFEPATLSLGKRPGSFAGSCRFSQPVATLDDSAPADFHSVASDPRFRSPFAAPVLQGFLTVREVAARLSVSTATVYKLCTRGELAYVRILGAIRLAPDDLAALVARRRTPSGHVLKQRAP